MKVAHISLSPVAGAAYFASESFKEAGYDSVCIAGVSYDDGRSFPADYSYPPTGEAVTKLNDADVIFCHQGKPYNAEWYPKHKPTIGWYHSQLTASAINRNLEKDGWPWCVVGQYQTRLYENAVPVPNLYPLKHPFFQPQKKCDNITIAYSPSNTDGTGWDDKGYQKTVDILNRIPCQVDIIRGVPIEECLSRKAKAHMVIDECVTGSYHRSSLDGLAFNCCVVNNCDDLCLENIKRMTGATYVPFVSVGIEILEQYLQTWLQRYESDNTLERSWFEEYWNPTNLIERNFLPLMEQALGKGNS